MSVYDNQYPKNSYVIVTNYLPNWRWLVLDIDQAAKRRGKYLSLDTETDWDNWFSIKLVGE